MGIKRYKAGTTIHIECLIRDVDDVLSSPDGGVVIYIYNESDSVEIDGAAMTEDSTGNYSYDWQSATDDEEGLYKVTCKATSGAKVVYKEDNSAFYLYT